MISTVLSALGAGRYYPHAICLIYDPLMLWAYSVLDLSIGAAYMTIGIGLILYRIRGIRVTRLSFDLFAGFIITCAMTHLTDVVTLFSGLYRLDLMMRIATAIISVATAAHVVRRLAGSDGDYSHAR